MKSDIVNPFPDTENVSLQKRPGLALESIHSFWGPVPWRPGCVAIGVWREPGRWLLLCEGAFAAEWLVKTGPSPLFFLRLCGVSRCFKGTVYIHTFCHISVGGNIFCSGKSTCFFVGYLKATRSTVRSLKPWKGAKSPEADWDGTATQCFPFSWHPRKRMTIPSEWYIYISSIQLDHQVSSNKSDDADKAGWSSLQLEDFDDAMFRVVQVIWSPNMPKYKTVETKHVKKPTFHLDMFIFPHSGCSEKP